MHTIQLKNERIKAKEEKSNTSFLLKFMDDAEKVIKQKNKDKELFSRPKMLKTRPSEE